jgi:hypothetical protein
LLTIAKVKPYKPVEKIYWCRGGMNAACVAALRCFEIAQDVPSVQQKIFYFGSFKSKEYLLQISHNI